MKRTVRMSNVLAKTFCGFYETLYNDELRLSNTEDNILGATVKEIDENEKVLSELFKQREQLEEQLYALDSFDERIDDTKKRLLEVNSLIRSLPRWYLADRDFKQYKNRVAEEHLLTTEYFLKEKLDGSEFEGMLSNLKLVKVHSPVYYCYGRLVDHLTFDVDVQKKQIEEFCCVAHAEEFENFLAHDVRLKYTDIFFDIHKDFFIEFVLNFLVDFKIVEECVYDKITELSDVVLEKYVDGVTYRYELDYDDGVYHAGNLIKDKVEVIA